MESPAKKSSTVKVSLLGAETFEVNTKPIKEQCRIKNLQLFTENLALKQKHRNPRKIVLVIDESNSYIQTEQLGSNVEALHAGFLSFDNAISFLEEHKILGKGYLIIFFSGLYSLVKCDVHSLCVTLKCKNPLLKYELVKAMSCENIIMKALQIHDNILNCTKEDQVLFSDIIPINITNRIMRKCSNCHAMRCDTPTDKYADFLKTIEKYNLFIRNHSLIMGYKGFNLLQTAFPPKRNVPLSLDLSSDYSDIDGTSLMKYISDNLRKISLQMNVLDSNISADSGNVTCDVFPERRDKIEKLFSKVIIITYPHYYDYLKNFEAPLVEIYVIKPTGIDGIVTAIKEKQITDSSNILWLTYFGLLSIAHIGSETSCCTFPPCVSPLDIILPNKSLSLSKDFVLDIHHHFFSLMEKVNSNIRPRSLFLVLPPFPPTFWMGNEEHHSCHSVKREENTIYFSNNREINEIKTLFSSFSKEMISLIVSELETTSLPSKTLQDYKDLTKNWSHHVQFLDDVNHKEFNSKFDAWYNAIRTFISDCLTLKGDSRSEKNGTIDVDHKSSLPGEDSCTINSGNTVLSNDSCILSSDDHCDITTEYDNLVFIGPREYLSLLSNVEDLSEHIMTVETNNLNWSFIKSKLNMESLACKNILFIIFGHLKLVNMEEKSLSTCPYNQNFIFKPNSFEEVAKNVKQLLFHFKISFAEKSRTILLPLLPLRCTQVLTNDSNTIYNTLNGQEENSKLLHAFNSVWEKEVFSLLTGNEHKFKNIISQYLPSSSWSTSTNDLEDLAFLHRKCKFFLNILISKACPLINIKNTLKQDEFFELEGSVNQRIILNLNSSHRNEIQRNNGGLKSPCSSFRNFKNMESPISVSDEDQSFLQLRVRDSDADRNVGKNQIVAEDARFHNKSKQEDGKITCIDLVDLEREEEFTSEKVNDLPCDNKTQKDIKEDLSDGKKKEDISRVNKIGEDILCNKKTKEGLSSSRETKGDLSHTKEAKRDLFRTKRTVSKLVLDMSKVRRVSKKFTHAYFVGNREPDVRFKNIRNGQHIYYDLSRVSEDDVPIILNKIGNMKDNSVCFLILGFETFTQYIASPTCIKYNCNKTIPVKKLENKDESLEGVTAFIAEKIIDLMMFVSKLSLFTHVIVLPFIPEILRHDDGNCYMKHKECHSIAKIGPYVTHGNIENWKICSATVKDIWNKFVITTYNNYFSSEDLDKYVSELNVLVFEDKVNEYSSVSPEFSQWETILSAFLNILLDITVNKNPAEYAVSKELESLKSDFIKCSKSAKAAKLAQEALRNPAKKKKKKKRAKARLPPQNVSNENSVPKPLNKRSSLPIDARPKKRLKKSNTESSNKEKENEDDHKTESDPMMFILGQSLYEEFIKEKDKLKKSLEEEFETFYSVPEIHHKYKAYFEEYNSKYSKAFSANQSKEHKDEYWKIYWNKKLNLLEKNELDERVTELEQTYKLKAKELVLGSQDLNLKMGIELEEKDIHVYDVISSDDELEKDSNLYDVIASDDELEESVQDSSLKASSASTSKVVSTDISSSIRGCDKLRESSAINTIQRRASGSSCIPLRVPTSVEVPLSTEGCTLKSLFSNKQNLKQDPVIPKEYPVIPKQDPVIPKRDPVIPKRDPVIPKRDPVIPKRDPVIPKRDPVIPKRDPVIPKRDPVIPKRDPVIPKRDPVIPKRDPVIPKRDPVIPKQDPVIPIMKSRFSVHGTVTLLEQLSDKFGVLGPAVLGVIESANNLGLDTNKALSLFTEEENVILFQMAIDKLKIIQKSSSGKEIPVLTQAIEWTTKLLDYSKNTCKLPKPEVRLNLENIAIASFNKTASFTLSLIKNAFIYEGNTDPSKEEINEIFLKVCSMHVEMSTT